MRRVVKFRNKIRALLMLSLFCFLITNAQTIKETRVSLGWSGNSVNTVVFRNSAVTTFKDVQFTAYYNPKGAMILAKRKLGSSKWTFLQTPYYGNIKDAHNDISIAVDAKGYLHVSWDHHNTKLRYAKSLKPMSLQLTKELPMTGLQETSVTYPEFHNLPNGKLLFCYRSGESGRGNMVINSYDVKTQKWTQLQSNLLDGENTRSAYWQMTVGENGAIYVSWVWRETWDVSTNHDMCYAVSYDGGITWRKSTGEKYKLPITIENAEIAWTIPQNRSLINQTSMTVDANGIPYIATYWKTNKVPQYKIIYRANNIWKLMETNFRKTPFDLGGGGTKSIPISRPKVFVNNLNVYLLYRDEEKDNKIMLAYRGKNKSEWKQLPLTSYGVGQWEPNYDENLWKKDGVLHVFSQKVEQVDGEGIASLEAQEIHIIEVEKLE
ncbi:hypothetical protein NBRC110019_13610 [Neptunitalea chrysea]|uniref:BNR repeat-containing family member n=1 Tax=Neptunitalea chrysea TaxID=1647581 RepID=A0A9W6B5P1_9FLAO|nr:BNR repeat-containing protein [Neptunitalea chrysea]GLB52322.1 hypothetical protein NBRC110019_13610 [Neptunitalea chrysea]